MLEDPLLWPTATEAFLEWGKSTNRFHGFTAVTYEKPLRSLQAYYPDQRVSQIMTVDRVLGFLESRGPVGQKGWSENTVDAHLRSFKSFSRFGARQGWCADLRDPLSDAFKVKLRTRRSANWLGQADVAAILAACPDDALGERDRAIVLLGCLTGLRREEMASCQWNHIDLKVRTLLVPKGKGDRARTVGLLDRAVEFLGDWKDRCASDLGAIPTQHPVLPTLLRPAVGKPFYLAWDRPARQWYGQRHPHRGPFWPMGDFSIALRVSEAGKRAGIDNLAPHDLRRSHAALLEEMGVSIQDISRQLGHASVETTMRYLENNPRKRASALAGLQVAF